MFILTHLNEKSYTTLISKAAALKFMHGYLHATHCAIQITNKRPRYKIMTLYSLATAFENIQSLGQNLKKWFMYSKKDSLTFYLSSYTCTTCSKSKTHNDTVIYIKFLREYGYNAMYTKIYRSCYYPVYLVKATHCQCDMQLKLSWDSEWHEFTRSNTKI